MKKKSGYANSVIFDYLTKNPNAFPREISKVTEIPKSTVFDSHPYQLYKRMRDAINDHLVDRSYLNDIKSSITEIIK